METKKVLGIIFSIIFVCSFAFVLSWAIINFNKVKDGMSSTGVYTKEDINKSYEDGYNTALIDKEEYTNLINSYRDTITTLNDNISQLNSQVNLLTNNNKDYVTQIDNLNKQKTNLETQVSNLSEIKTANETTIASLNEQIEELQAQVTNLTNSSTSKTEQINQLNSQITTLQNTVAQLQATNEMNVNTITSLNTQISNLNAQISDMTLQSQNSQSQINALNNKINELQASVTYYESYIASLENGEQVVATFEFDGSVYNIQIVNKGSKLSVTTPTSTDYKMFNCWTVNGSAIDLNTFVINTNTKIVADVTYKYDVKFKVDNTIYNSQIVTKNGYVTLPTNPTKEGYEFDYWTTDGVTQTNPSSIKINQNTTFIAKFTQLFTVQFIYDNEIISTQVLRSGSTLEPINLSQDKLNKFLGWTINGNDVDINTYTVYANVIITAKFITHTFVNTNFDGLPSPIGGYSVFYINGNSYVYIYSNFYVYNSDNQSWTDAGWDIDIFKGFDYRYIWTDGNNSYYSRPDYNIGSQINLMYDNTTNNWVAVSWTNSPKQFWGYDIWSDGINCYYNLTYIINTKTNTWSSITFNGFSDSNFIPSCVWNAGNNCYYSNGSQQYVLDMETHTWSIMTWNGLTSFSSNHIWSDGINYFYSEGSKQYILNVETHTWITTNWSGLSEFDGKFIWSDGSKCYFSNGTTSGNYVIYI